MDYFSKWVEAYVSSNQEATLGAKTLVRKFVNRFYKPLELHSDQGRNFEATVFQGFCKLLRILETRTAALHPHSDGFNRTHEQNSRKAVGKSSLRPSMRLRTVLLIVPVIPLHSIYETTGVSPTKVLFRREPRLSCVLKFGCKPNKGIAVEDYVSNLRRRMDETYDRIRSNIQNASDRMKKRHDVSADKGCYQVGDLVWLFGPKKRRGFSPTLQKSWNGLYEYRLLYGKPMVVHFENYVINEQILGLNWIKIYVHIFMFLRVQFFWLSLFLKAFWI